MHPHPFDPVSFVFGLIFLGLGLTTVFSDEDIAFLEARWIWPALLVTAGARDRGLHGAARPWR